MGRIWVLDTETKGTGAEMVPLDKAQRKERPAEAKPFVVPPKPKARPPKPAPPRAPHGRRPARRAQHRRRQRVRLGAGRGALAAADARRAAAALEPPGAGAR